MVHIKEIKIKNQTYYLFYDMINMKDFVSSLLKIDKKSNKIIDVCYIWYISQIKKIDGKENIGKSFASDH